MIKPFTNSPPLFLVLANSAILLLWGLALLLGGAGFPYVLPLAGSLVFVAPALCLALLLGQLVEVRSHPLISFLWAMVFTATVTPAAIYGLSTILFHQSPLVIGPPIFIVWWAGCFAASSVVMALKRQSWDWESWNITREDWQNIGIIIGLFILVLVANFVIYPYLPEADGYYVLMKLRALQLNPALLSSTTRLPFYIFLNTAAKLLSVDPYWILKVVLPLMQVTTVLSVYLWSGRQCRQRYARILLSLSPLFFPVILEEMLIGRPQSLVLLTFLPGILLATTAVMTKKHISQLYWLIALLVIGLIGLKTHTLFVAIVITAVVAIVLFFRREIRMRPLDAIFIVLALLTLAYPWIGKTRLLQDGQEIARLFLMKLRHPRFDLWFIDSYRTVDGAELGWPGLSALYYYGYNLGLFLPAGLLAALLFKKTSYFRSRWRPRYNVWFVLLVLFFFIAEIAPRFQVAYLPDRAWLFVALLLSFLVPAIAEAVGRSRLPKKTLFLGIVGLGVLSILSGCVLTYAKQGWVTRNEVVAAPFIRSHIPEHAVFLSQGGVRTMVQYYTNRTAFRPEDKAIFLTGDKEAMEAYLRQQETTYAQSRDQLHIREAELEKNLTVALDLSRSPSVRDTQVKELKETLMRYEASKNAVVTEQRQLSDRYPTVGRPVYLIYNLKKFDSLYGQRQWWRESNFYGANLSAISNTYPLIYDKDGIMIWEVRK